MTTKNPTPARLFVLLARSAPVGVILRRGPSDWVQLIQWHTKSDVFRPGQWFHGRIFENNCDLSADGKYFVYRAFKPNNKLRHPDVGNSWTAVSKPPNFTAVALWRTWGVSGGGGYFFKDGTMLLNHLDDNRELHPAFRLPKDLEVKTIETYEDESYFQFDHLRVRSMLLNGWTVLKSSPHPNLWHTLLHNVTDEDTPVMILGKSRKNFTLICGVFLHHDFVWHTREQHIPVKMRSVLRPYRVKAYNYDSSYRFRYTLKIGDVEHDLEGVTWADFDQQKRLVLAKDGKLFSVSTDTGEPVLTELADFNYSRQPTKP